VRDRALLRSWFWTVTAAEFVGFAVPALVGALTADTAATIALPALLAAGAIEGSMLGWGQASVLRRAISDFRRRPWVIATAAAAVFAYALGLAPSTFTSSIENWPTAVLILAAVVLGGLLLVSIGSAQWLILRRYVAGAARWIAASALAWIVGLGVFLAFTMPLWQTGQPLALTVGIGVVGGLLMAATSSAITGVALRRLLR
jgi:uncharacterized integral membrane protein